MQMSRKLTLKKESLRQLRSAELERVAGGRPLPTLDCLSPSKFQTCIPESRGGTDCPQPW